MLKKLFIFICINLLLGSIFLFLGNLLMNDFPLILMIQLLIICLLISSVFQWIKLSNKQG